MCFEIVLINELGNVEILDWVLYFGAYFLFFLETFQDDDKVRSNIVDFLLPLTLADLFASCASPSFLFQNSVLLPVYVETVLKSELCLFLFSNYLMSLFLPAQVYLLLQLNFHNKFEWLSFGFLYFYLFDTLNFLFFSCNSSTQFKSIVADGLCYCAE